MGDIAGEVFSRGKARVALPEGVEEGFLLLLQITGCRRLRSEGEEKLFHEGRDGGVPMRGDDARWGATSERGGAKSDEQRTDKECPRCPAHGPY